MASTTSSTLSSTPEESNNFYPLENGHCAPATRTSTAKEEEMEAHSNVTDVLHTANEEEMNKLSNGKDNVSQGASFQNIIGSNLSLDNNNGGQNEEEEMHHPHPIQIMSLEREILELEREKLERENLILNEKLLQSITNKNNCDKIPVAVISIIGPQRSGKSFLLNFILQYFQQQQLEPPLDDNIKLTPSWMKDLSPESGFHFAAGLEPDTKGIFLWSEPIITKDKDGNKVALLIMDAQGLYDKNTSSVGNKLLCSVVSLLSSIVILNIKGHIDEKYLESFGQMLDFAREIMSKEDKNPFQEMIFTIRDFQLEDDMVGWEGGKEVLENFLFESDEQMEENVDNRTKFMQCYPHAGCFLFPYPGENVTSHFYRGSLESIKEDFRERVSEFVLKLPHLLQARIISSKKGSLTGSEWYNLCKTLCTEFHSKSKMTATQIKECILKTELQSIMNDLVNNYHVETQSLEAELRSKEKKDNIPADEYLLKLQGIHATTALKVRQLFQEVMEEYKDVKQIEFRLCHGSPVSVLSQILDQMTTSSLDQMAPEMKSRNEKEKLEKQRTFDEFNQSVMLNHLQQLDSLVDQQMSALKQSNRNSTVNQVGVASSSNHRDEHNQTNSFPYNLSRDVLGALEQQKEFVLTQFRKFFS